MSSLELAGGTLRVTYPDSYQLAPRGPEPVAGQPGPAPEGTAMDQPSGPAPEVSDALVEAIASQSLDLVASFELVPAASSGLSAGREQPPSRPGKVRLALDLPPEQDAVVLLEQDGFYSWQLSTATDPGTTRVSRFEIDVRPGIPVRPSARTSPARGPFGDFVVGAVKAHVLRFSFPDIPGAVLTFLERDIRPGLVVMTGTDVRQWPLVHDLEQVDLPKDRPAKILLFVHGTFSSTAGSFGALTTTAQGRTFLKLAEDSYDAVLGFDHVTLSRDPLENAVDLLARLEAGHPDPSATIDIISYSRGALVARSLIEYLIPSPSGLPVTLGKVVFVGGTNAGTQLAEPDNWRVFLDLQTNLAAAAARSVESAGGVAGAGDIVAGVVRGVGAFVKYLVVSASLTDPFVPGLAAMEPDGQFINSINATQPGQPSAGTPWYVVSSDFEVKLLDDHHEPPELPRQLVTKLADGLVDRLMGASNDLVVDTASMSSVDLQSGGGFIKDTLDLGTNSVVYHLNYFIQPRVCRALASWLA